MACGGMIFKKNFKFKKKSSFYFISFIFFMYYCCSINLKRQSEHSGLRPDTSSLVYFIDKIVIKRVLIQFSRKYLKIQDIRLSYIEFLHAWLRFVL